MRRPLRVLLIEDSESDALLTMKTLERGGYAPTFRRVSDGDAMRSELIRNEWDLVLCDHRLPRFDSLAALGVFRESGLDIPFMILSGEIDEELAVTAMRAGAHDYLRKDNLRRLVPSVERELREADERRRRRRAEEALKESEEAFRLLIEGAKGYALIMLDADGLISSWNAGARALWGLSEEEVIGRPCTTLLEAGDAATGPVAHVLSEALAKGRAEHADWARRGDGSRFWASGTVTALWDPTGRRRGFVKVTRDMTEQKRDEERTAELLRREQEAHARADRLREEAVEAARMKDEFLATLSHELRTPLSAVLGFSEQLNGKLERAEDRMALDAIRRNGKVLAGMIDSLLDASAFIFGNSTMSIQRFDLRTVILAAIETNRLPAASKRIRLDAWLGQAPVHCNGNPTRVTQVAWNLISNSIKFTPSGGRIDVGLRCVDGHAELTVRDTGEGIDPAFLPHVFEKFRQQNSSSTRRHGGLGLGLAIVREVVELHGGTVRAESAGQGMGSVFTVRIPIAPDASQAQTASQERAALAASQPPRERLKGVRVLVVDDSPDNLILAECILKGFGAEVLCVDSAAKAFAQVEKSAADVMVADIGMPDENGYSLIRRIRAAEARTGRHVPAVAVTAYARDEERKRALEAGFELHLAKPIETEKLVDAVASLARH